MRIDLNAEAGESFGAWTLGNEAAIAEAFPERAYLQNGRRTPHSLPGSSIHDPDQAARRAVQVVIKRGIETIEGGWLELEAQSPCIHGDNPNAALIARAVRGGLEASRVSIVSFATGGNP